jgi:ADP-ribosylglycohydrolase
MTREEITAKYGWVDDFVSDDPAGTDDTEYAVLTARIVLRHGHGLTPADVTAAWRENLVEQDGGFYGGGFSEMTAINNLRAGLSAPRTGTDNHEMWSDGTAMRIAPVGVFCAGDPQEAARLAAIDAQVSHARDGIYCGQAVAAAVAAALVESSWEAVIEAGLGAVPPGSWSARMIGRAVVIGRRAPDLRSAVDQLYEEISLFHYPWADIAPEATALAFGVLAMAGGMAGALHGAEAVPERWRIRINRVRGHCIKAVADTDLADLAAELHQALGTEHVNETDAVR